MIKKAILLKEKNFFLINYLNTGYWLGEEYLAYYDDKGKLAQGDLIGQLILVEDCIKIIKDELNQGIYNVKFAYVNVKREDFNRKYNISKLKNWIGWTTKHKRYDLIEENICWIKKL